MDPFDELAQSIVVAYQEPGLDVFKACGSKLPEKWRWSSDGQRRIMVRDLLYEQRDLARELVMNVKTLPAFFEQLGRDAVERRDGSHNRVAWFARFKSWVTEVFERWLGPHTRTAPKPLPEWIFSGDSGAEPNERDIARICAADPGKAAELARILQSAVPFSIVWARELEEIRRSRKLRYRIDPEMWVAELRADPEARLNQVKDVIETALQLREEWHRLRIKEQLLAEQLPESAPRGMDERSESQEKIRKEARTLRLERKRLESEAAAQRKLFRAQFPKLSGDSVGGDTYE